MPTFDVASHDPFFESCPCLKALLNRKILLQYLDEPNDQVKWMEDPFKNLKILSKMEKPSNKKQNFTCGRIT
jgi:hypothetical protein